MIGRMVIGSLVYSVFTVKQRKQRNGTSRVLNLMNFGNRPLGF